MTHALTRAEVREFDRRAIEELGVPGVVLMENAGRGAAELLLSLGIHGRVVICCGKGNNGGDGFVIARHLDLHGCDVRVWLFCPAEQLQGDAKVHYEIIAKMGLPIHPAGRQIIEKAALQADFAQAEWIIDALFGIGLDGPLRPPFDTVSDAINSSRAKVLAVDIPSGLDCDTGQPLGPTVRADHTATFVALKPGFLKPGADSWTGQVHVIPIGVSVGRVCPAAGRARNRRR